LNLKGLENPVFVGLSGIPAWTNMMGFQIVGVKILTSHGRWGALDFNELVGVLRFS
jgi:hypothetical protein